MVRKILCVVCLIICLTALQAQAASEDFIRVGVMKFQSRADGVMPNQAAVVGDIFTRILANSRTIAVIEREQLEAIAAEQRMGMSGLMAYENAAKIGKLAGCQYMILGSVTNLTKKASAFGLLVVATTKEEATATIDVRVIDVETSEIVLTLSDTGKSAQSGTYFSYGGLSYGEADISGMEANAISEAASKLSFKIRDALTGEAPMVINTGAREVMINIGSTGGAKSGALYRVYTDGAEIRNVDGSSLGRKMNDIAVIKITDVQADFSTATIAGKDTGNLGLIRKGDKISPINTDELKALTKRKAFPKDRPRERLGDDDVNNMLNESRSDNSVTDTEEIRSSSYTPPTPAPSNTGRNFENKSTDPAKVIPTYGLPSGEANVRRIAHTNARKLGDKSKQAYDKYVELANSSDVDYLAAYRAGVIAMTIGRKNDAATWLDKALEINPDYEPAQQAKAKLNSSSTTTTPRRNTKRRK